MPQQFANVSLANTFNVWLVRTNQIATHLSKLANTSGVANIKSANAVFSNITTLSGPVVQSGNSTISGNVAFTNNRYLKFIKLFLAGGNAHFTSNVTFGTTGAIKVPVGNTAQRDAHNSIGHFRYNTEKGMFEGYKSGGWQSFAGDAYVTSTFIANTTARTLINNRMQVANTTLLVNDRMQVANTNTLINSRMQVANTKGIAIALQIVFG